MGHLLNLLPLVRGLCGRGHRVFAALRDLSQAKSVFAGIDVALLQSPYKATPPGDPVRVPRSFAHVLYNVGFGDPPELESLVEAWRNLFALVAPDLVVFEHSPTAVLAARGRRVGRVLLGNGFFCPPDVTPFPDLRPWLPPDPEIILRVEQRVLESANAALAGLGQPALTRLGQLYAEVDEVLLTTLPELDHYPGRRDGRYRGPWLSGDGEPPRWPAGRGYRVFAYLKPSPTVPKLLALLAQRGCPTILAAGGIPPHLLGPCAASNLRFEFRRLDLRQAAAECDLAILNGNHATTLAMLLAGRPVLQLPVFLEQELNARATAELGAGVFLPPDDHLQLASALENALERKDFAAAAQGFAARYAGLDAPAEIAAATDRLTQLLAGGS